MSRTDKTRPMWVKIQDPYNRRYVDEDHSAYLHARGECDFMEGVSTWSSFARISGRRPTQIQWCGLNPKLSYGGFGEFYARACGSWCVICDPSMLQNGCERMRWRVLARMLVKTPVEDLYDVDEWTTEPRYLKRVRGEHWN